MFLNQKQYVLQAKNRLQLTGLETIWIERFLKSFSLPVVKSSFPPQIIAPVILGIVRKIVGRYVKAKFRSSGGLQRKALLVAGIKPM